MENAADALKMAGAVLIFVLAISITIMSFGQVRQAADTILNYKDRETVYIDGKFYYKATGTERQVELETIVPSVFRAYLENYKIVFNGLSSPIYTIKLNDGTSIDKYTLDLETNSNLSKNVTLANNEQKSEFLCGIFYGKFKSGKTYNDFQDKFNIILPGGSSYKTLYEQLKGKTITEYLGVYYQSDSEDEPNVNKTEKRIINYVIK